MNKIFVCDVFMLLSSSPVKIPDLGGVVHGARSQEIPTGVEGAPPHRVGVFHKCVHALGLRKVPDLCGRVAGNGRQLRTSAKQKTNFKII